MRAQVSQAAGMSGSAVTTAGFTTAGDGATLPASARQNFHARQIGAQAPLAHRRKRSIRREQDQLQTGAGTGRRTRLAVEWDSASPGATRWSVQSSASRSSYIALAIACSSPSVMSCLALSCPFSIFTTCSRWQSAPRPDYAPGNDRRCRGTNPLRWRHYGTNDEPAAIRKCGRGDRRAGARTRATILRAQAIGAVGWASCANRAEKTVRASVRSTTYKRIGWGGRIRTCECRYQKRVPYRLATPHQSARLYDSPPITQPLIAFAPLRARSLRGRRRSALSWPTGWADQDGSEAGDDGRSQPMPPGTHG